MPESNQKDLQDAIQAWAQARGYRVAFGGVSHLAEVLKDLNRRREAREIDPAFFSAYLGSLVRPEQGGPENARSIILVAAPRPAHILTFVDGGKTVETILPPTYVRYRQTFTDVRDDLAGALSGLVPGLELLNSPLKALANRLGLLSYGRNNLGYIDGLGSYFQLVGLVCGPDLGEGLLSSRRAEPLLPRCRDCRICAAACSAGAIRRDAITIQAEKCYTLYSESPEPFPAGLKPPSPRCLIGCLRCQELCPENKNLLKLEEAPVSFDAEETDVFLGRAPDTSPAAAATRAKFRKLGLTEDFPLFARNLKRLVENPPPKRSARRTGSAR